MIYLISINYNQEIMYRLDCSWNFRTDHCTGDFTCISAKNTGPKILHGSRKFFTKSDNSFSRIYNSLNNVIDIIIIKALF